MKNANPITLHDKVFTPFISETQINEVIQRIANEINTDYNRQIPVFISVLNGAFMFTSDLMKKITLPCELSFVKLASYSGINSTGKVSELLGLTTNIKNRPVIVLEDIIDSGTTIEHIVNKLNLLNPLSIAIAALFFKPKAYQKEIHIQYKGFEIGNEFIVGYGLDYNEMGRNLPEVYRILNN